MQLHLTGSTTINAKRERVFQLLTDPNFIATTLPDAVEVAVLDKENLEAKMKVKAESRTGRAGRSGRSAGTARPRRSGRPA